MKITTSVSKLMTSKERSQASMKKQRHKQAGEISASSRLQN